MRVEPTPTVGSTLLFAHNNNKHIGLMRQESPAVIEINQDRLFRWLFSGLLTTAVAIVLLDAVLSEFEWVSIGAAQRLFNITREDGIPNFFSSFQLLAVGVVLLMITIVVQRQSRGQGSRAVVGWGLTTGLFFFLGIDDATKLHERVGSIFKALVSDASGEPDTSLLGRSLDVFPSYPWQLVLGPFFAVAGLFLLIFLMKELPSFRLRGLVILAMGLFVVAVLMDFVEGMDSDPLDDIADLLSMPTGRVVHFSKSIEEFLEMVGTTTFLFVFLNRLLDLTPSITFKLTDADKVPD